MTNSLFCPLILFSLLQMLRGECSLFEQSESDRQRHLNDIRPAKMVKHSFSSADSQDTTVLPIRVRRHSRIWFGSDGIAPPSLETVDRDDCERPQDWVGFQEDPYDLDEFTSSNLKRRSISNEIASFDRCKQCDEFFAVKPDFNSGERTNPDDIRRGSFRNQLPRDFRNNSTAVGFSAGGSVESEQLLKDVKTSEGMCEHNLKIQSSDNLNNKVQDSSPVDSSNSNFEMRDSVKDGMFRREFDKDAMLIANEGGEANTAFQAHSEGCPAYVKFDPNLKDSSSVRTQVNGLEVGIKWPTADNVETRGEANSVAQDFNEGFAPEAKYGLKLTSNFDTFQKQKRIESLVKNAKCIVGSRDETFDKVKDSGGDMSVVKADCLDSSPEGSTSFDRFIRAQETQSRPFANYKNIPSFNRSKNAKKVQFSGSGEIAVTSGAKFDFIPGDSASLDTGKSASQSSLKLSLNDGQAGALRGNQKRTILNPVELSNREVSDFNLPNFALHQSKQKRSESDKKLKKIKKSKITVKDMKRVEPLLTALYEEAKKNEEAMKILSGTNQQPKSASNSAVSRCKKDAGYVPLETIKTPIHSFSSDPIKRSSRDILRDSLSPKISLESSVRGMNFMPPETIADPIDSTPDTDNDDDDDDDTESVTVKVYESALKKGNNSLFSELRFVPNRWKHIPFGSRKNKINNFRDIDDLFYPGTKAKYSERGAPIELTVQNQNDFTGIGNQSDDRYDLNAGFEHDAEFSDEISGSFTVKKRSDKSSELVVDEKANANNKSSTESSTVSPASNETAKEMAKSLKNESNKISASTSSTDRLSSGETESEVSNVSRKNISSAALKSNTTAAATSRVAIHKDTSADITGDVTVKLAKFLRKGSEAVTTSDLTNSSSTEQVPLNGKAIQETSAEDASSFSYRNVSLIPATKDARNQNTTNKPLSDVVKDESSSSNVAMNSSAAAKSAKSVLVSTTNDGSKILPSSENVSISESNNSISNSTVPKDSFSENDDNYKLENSKATLEEREAESAANLSGMSDFREENELDELYDDELPVGSVALESQIDSSMLSNGTPQSVAAAVSAREAELPFLPRSSLEADFVASNYVENPEVSENIFNVGSESSELGGSVDEVSSKSEEKRTLHKRSLLSYAPFIGSESNQNGMKLLNSFPWQNSVSKSSSKNLRNELGADLISSHRQIETNLYLTNPVLINDANFQTFNKPNSNGFKNSNLNIPSNLELSFGANITNQFKNPIDSGNFIPLVPLPPGELSSLKTHSKNDKTEPMTVNSSFEIGRDFPSKISFQQRPEASYRRKVVRRVGIAQPLNYKLTYVLTDPIERLTRTNEDSKNSSKIKDLVTGNGSSMLTPETVDLRVEEIISGKVPNRLIETVLLKVNSHGKTESSLGLSSREFHKESLPDSRTESEVKLEAEKIMVLITKQLTHLIRESSKSQHCYSLKPELRDFLRWLLTPPPKRDHACKKGGFCQGDSFR